MKQNWEDKVVDESIRKTICMLVHFANESISVMGNNQEAYNAIVTAENLISFYDMELEIAQFTDITGMHFYRLNSTN